MSDKPSEHYEGPLLVAYNNLHRLHLHAGVLVSEEPKKKPGKLNGIDVLNQARNNHWGQRQLATVVDNVAKCKTAESNYMLIDADVAREVEAEVQQLMTQAKSSGQNWQAYRDAKGRDLVTAMLMKDEEDLEELIAQRIHKQNAASSTSTDGPSSSGSALQTAPSRRRVSQVATSTTLPSCHSLNDMDASQPETGQCDSNGVADNFVCGEDSTAAPGLGRSRSAGIVLTTTRSKSKASMQQVLASAVGGVAGVGADLGPSQPQGVLATTVRRRSCIPDFVMEMARLSPATSQSPSPRGSQRSLAAMSSGLSVRDSSSQAYGEHGGRQSLPGVLLQSTKLADAGGSASTRVRWSLTGLAPSDSTATGASSLSRHTGTSETPSGTDCSDSPPRRAGPSKLAPIRALPTTQQPLVALKEPSGLGTKGMLPPISALRPAGPATQ